MRHIWWNVVLLVLALLDKSGSGSVFVAHTEFSLEAVLSDTMEEGVVPVACDK